jgi:peptidoglycan/xylan/chitin deacetylase (PgdA/CDA1 family)
MIASILVAMAITAFVITAVRGPQSYRPEQSVETDTMDQGLPQTDKGTASSRIRPTSFRFPEEHAHPSKDDQIWRDLGSKHHGENNQKQIFGFLQHRILHFTFDDGPYTGTTPKMLDMLSAYNIRATFFVIGKYLFGPDAQAHTDLVRRIDKAGHTVAIHSYTHKDFRDLSTAQINRELYRSGRLLKSILGYHPGLFRPPYGGRNLQTKALIHDHGYTEILWNIAPEEYGASTPHEILGNFQAALDRQERHSQGPGGIVLLHDSRSATVQAFPLIMEELRRRNCLILQKDGEELWDVVGNLRYFLDYESRLPQELITRRQLQAREAATRYCAESQEGINM